TLLRRVGLDLRALSVDGVLLLVRGHAVVGDGADRRWHGVFSPVEWPSFSPGRSGGGSPGRPYSCSQATAPRWAHPGPATHVHLLRPCLRASGFSARFLRPDPMPRQESAGGPQVDGPPIR